ncbi:MAG TPA: DinB family protein [Thermoanaerobaculia bacterium]|nr:DinB family protein [Thermoanaerobaculia bacterium]
MTTPTSGPPSIFDDQFPPPGRVETTRLADQLERSFRGGAWHGPSLAEALEGVDADAAAHRAAEDVHTIAEIAGHVAFWIDAARRRMEGENVTDVPPEVDFPRDGAATPEAWRRTLAGLDQAHRALHAALLALDDERLDAAVAGSDPTVRGQLLGILQHNAYHAGQIAVLKKGAGSGR